MWFGEPHPFPERGSPTRLGASGQQSYEGWSCRNTNTQIMQYLLRHNSLIPSDLAKCFTTSHNKNWQTAQPLSAITICSAKLSVYRRPWASGHYVVSAQRRPIYVKNYLLIYCCQPHKSAIKSLLYISPVAYPGWGFGCSKPPPRNSEGPPKNRAKLNPIVKTVKNCWI